MTDPSREELKLWAEWREKHQDIVTTPECWLSECAAYALKLLDENEGLRTAVKRFQEKELDQKGAK